MSKILNWATKAAQAVQENVARDGVATVASRVWKNFGQLKFGTLVGEDEFGNKYYEDFKADEYGSNVQGRHRWVEYPTLNRYKVSGSKIPPEWHSWLHFTTDLPAPKIKEQFEKPRFKLEYRENQTATPNAYSPSNYMKNPNYNPAQAMDAKEEAIQGVIEDKTASSLRRSYKAEEL